MSHDANHDVGMNLKPGVNYCAPKGKIDFRGIGGKSGFARLIPLAELDKIHDEIFFFFGVDVPASILPYIPDMGPKSDFHAKGHWHYYEIEIGIFIAHLTPTKGQEGSFTERHVLQAVIFKGESGPRIFLDMRKQLESEGILGPADVSRIKEILREKEIPL